MPDDKVLDVPAVDMTDAGLAKRKPAQRAAKKPTRRRDGSIGRATFEGVNKLTADGSMTKQAAFAVYGKQTKTQPGTVSANYYRVARAAGPVKPRKRRAAATSNESRSVVSAPSRGGRPRSSAGSDLDARLSSLVSSIEDLATALKQERAETDDLRRRLDGLRALV